MDLVPPSVFHIHCKGGHDYGCGTGPETRQCLDHSGRSSYSGQERRLLEQCEPKVHDIRKSF